MDSVRVNVNFTGRIFVDVDVNTGTFVIVDVDVVDVPAIIGKGMK